MRHPRLLPAVLALAAVAAPAVAQPPAAFDDAAVHSIQFVDQSEGWAAGDDGVVWHSIDGGATWERQKTGTRASLRGVHFQTPYTGWTVGRIDRPGGVSVGVMLKTTDGGLKWEEVGLNVLPGLHGVRFFDELSGFVCGDGSDAFPSGLFATADGGRSWRAVAGPRSPGWRAMDFAGRAGVVGGAWSKLGAVKDGGYADADLDPLGGRSIHGVKAGPLTSYAVGDGGLVLASTDGVKWGSVNLGLAPAVLANCDFRCVAASGDHVWVAGRPGSVVLHSGDAGKTWEVQKTNLTAAVNAVHFLDDKVGWLAGEFGTVAGTADGGKTWKVQRAGGQRAAALFLHADGQSVPLDVVSQLGHADGYLCATVGLMTADPAGDSKRAADPARLRQAVRMAGGLAAETAWCFPVPSHAEGLPPRELMATWDKAHDGKANEQLLRQAVLAVRVWQPEVIVTDLVATDARPADVLALHAAKEAFKQAADPACFPEQIAELGLKPWAAKKLYALTPDPKAPVKLDLTETHPTLLASHQELSEPAGRLLVGDAPTTGRRLFQLIAHRLDGSDKHAGLMDGVVLARGGAARRPEAAFAENIDPAAFDLAKKAAQARRHVEGLAAVPDAELGGADKALAALVAQTKAMPDETAARTMHAVGAGFARAGRWPEAREVFALLTDKHPGHPLAADANRWLLRYHAGTETRRRVEIGQKVAFARVAFDPAAGGQAVVPAGGSVRAGGTANTSEDVYRLYDQNMIVKWHQAALDLEPKLAALGPVYTRDPSAWLSLLAARRQVGRHADAERFVRDYFKANPEAVALPAGADPWRDALAAELWLSDKNAFPVPPKPAATCRYTDARPYLDGKLDDECWKDGPGLAVKVQGGDKPSGEPDPYATEARFAYDGQFLYVGVSCRHPKGEMVKPAGRRGRDADLTGRDRVEILLDMDRDYQTYYRFRIDHRGCLAEDCWGDSSWNPKYFVAFEPTETGWTAEYAIPLVELTGDRPSSGRSWAANVVRVVPGKGIRAWSGPADADPRPEGMGLLQFRAER